MQHSTATPTSSQNQRKISAKWVPILLPNLSVSSAALQGFAMQIAAVQAQGTNSYIAVEPFFAH